MHPSVARSANNRAGAANNSWGFRRMYLMRRFLGTWPRRGAVLAVVLAVGCCLAISFWWSDEQDRSPHVQAAVVSSTAKIVVGPNVRVSTAYASDPHSETVIAADPNQALRLFAFAMCDLAAKSSIVGYLSEDGGKSWRVSFERQAGPGKRLCDPSLAFGPDGTLYFVCLDVTLSKETKATKRNTSMLFFRCLDGRTKWEHLSAVHHNNPNPPQNSAIPVQVAADRPWLTVDGTTGQNRGRLYCASWLWLDFSSDQGRTFTDVPQPASKEFVDYSPANPVVLSDGTLVMARRMWSGRPHNLPGIGILRSDDGGQTLLEGPLVGTDRHDQQLRFGSAFRFTVQLAADTSASEYRDRIYAVWEDGQTDANSPAGQPQRPGPGRILFAFSKDKGISWVGPVILSEQSENGKNGYGTYMPAIAVNKEGHIAVTWYDRRGLPAAPGLGPPFYAPGCNVRIRISLDGGETWQPSVQVNEKAIKASVWDLRDTAGLAADTFGVFHPVWIDDRNGTTQVWTGTVGVEKR
jgi:hypothetical protein